MEELLRQILEQLKQPESKLGFTTAPSTLYIYANRSNNCNWYVIKDGEVAAIEHSALTGYLSELKIEKVERRGKEVIKLQTFIKGDRPYCIESGFDSHFSKGLLSAIAAMTPEQLKQPITISPQPGTDESVLFCRVYIHAEPVRCSYDEQTDWQAVSSIARANVNGDARANSRSVTPRPPNLEAEPPEPDDDEPPQSEEFQTINLTHIRNCIGSEIDRVGWSKKQGSAYLQQTYNGKKTRAELTEDELLDFSAYLGNLPNKAPVMVA